MNIRGSNHPILHRIYGGLHNHAYARQEEHGMHRGTVRPSNLSFIPPGDARREHHTFAGICIPVESGITPGGGQILPTNHGMLDGV